MPDIDLLMIIQQFTIIMQVSHYSTKRHSAEPLENDTAPQKAQHTHCPGAVARQVQKHHTANKLCSGENGSRGNASKINVSEAHASKINSGPKELHRKLC